MKNFEIIQNINAIERLKSKERAASKSKYSVKVGFFLTSNRNKLKNAYIVYEDFKKELDKEYLVFEGEKIKMNNNAPVLKDESKQGEYSTKLIELLNEEQEVNLSKITFEDLEKCHDLTLEEQEDIFFMLEE